jgi:hypothetical protein
MAGEPADGRDDGEHTDDPASDFIFGCTFL